MSRFPAQNTASPPALTPGAMRVVQLLKLSLNASLKKRLARPKPQLHQLPSSLKLSKAPDFVAAYDGKGLEVEYSRFETLLLNEQTLKEETVSRGILSLVYKKTKVELLFCKGVISQCLLNGTRLPVSEFRAFRGEVGTIVQRCACLLQ